MGENGHLGNLGFRDSSQACIKPRCLPPVSSSRWHPTEGSSPCGGERASSWATLGMGNGTGGLRALAGPGHA